MAQGGAVVVGNAFSGVSDNHYGWVTSRLYLTSSDDGRKLYLWRVTYPNAYKDAAYANEWKKMPVEMICLRKAEAQ